MGHQYTSPKGMSLLSYETAVGIDGLFYNIYICEWWKDQINTFLNWKFGQNSQFSHQAKLGTHYVISDQSDMSERRRCLVL